MNIKKLLVMLLCGIVALTVAVTCIKTERSKNIAKESQPVIESLEGMSWHFFGKYGRNWVFHKYYLTEEDVLYKEYKNRDWEVISIQDGVMEISVDGYLPTYEILYTEENGVYTIDMLRYMSPNTSIYEYPERIKDKSELLVELREELDTIRAEAFAGNDTMKMIEYIEWVKTNLNPNDIPIIECFPYQEMKNYIETYGAKVILENGVGGYYDNIQDQYENVQYWYSPLSEQKYSSGSVGTYRYTDRYEFYGDLMYRVTEKYWYDTSPNDPNNSKTPFWYYKDKPIGNAAYVGIEMLLRNIAEASGIECLYSIENGDEIMLCAIERANIHIIHNREMVTIAYE